MAQVPPMKPPRPMIKKPAPPPNPPRANANVVVGTNPNIAGGPRTPIRKPAFKIESAVDKTRYLKMLVYAGYGVGKTLLAGTSADVPQMQDVFMISAEAGDLTLNRYDNIDVVVAKSFDDVARIQEFLKRHCKWRDSDADEDIQRLIEEEQKFRDEDIEEPKRYRTCIIDSLSEVETYCMYQLTGVSDNTRLDEEVQSAEWSEYKKQHTMIQRLVRAFRDLPMNVIFTCAQAYVQDENKRKTYAPALTGKLSSQVQGFMDVVGYLTVQDAKEDGTVPRRLHIQPSPSGRYEAKNRFPGYKQRYIDIPDIDAGAPGMEVILKAVGLLETKKVKAKA